MSKYYKVIKENFLWEVGAILHDMGGGYRPLAETDMWDKTAYNQKEYISSRIVENCPEYFQRVYPVNLLSKTVYKLKEEARAYFEQNHSE